jgi:hypothetical protein
MRWPKASYSMLSTVAAGDAEARRRVAIDADEHRQAAVLQLGRDIGDLRICGHAVHQARHPDVELVRVGASSTNWYWVRLTVESMLRSCDGCM